MLALRGETSPLLQQPWDATIGTTYGSLIQVASMVWLFGSMSVVGFLGRRWLRAPAPPAASE